jgi:hypothetical protein
MEATLDGVSLPRIELKSSKITYSGKVKKSSKITYSGKVKKSSKITYSDGHFKAIYTNQDL